MKKSLFKFPETMTAQARNAFHIAALIGIAHFLAIPYYLYLAYSGQTVANPFLILAAVTAILGILFGIGAVLSWRGQSTAGTLLVLIALAVSYPPVSATLVGGLGLVLGLALMIAGPMIAFQVLSRRLTGVMSILTVASGLATLLLDIFGSTTRPSLPGIVIQILAAAVVAIFGVLIFRQFGSFRIQTRLTALVLVATIPLLIGVTAFISSRAGQTIEEQANLDLEENNDALATNVSSWLEQQIQTLNEMATLPDITSMDAARQRPTLQVIAAAHPNLFLVHTADLSGMNIARNDEEEPKDYHDRNWFLGAKAGAPITIEALISRTTGKPALNLSTPIRNQYGQIVGVASIVSHLDEISQEVLSHEEGRGITFIVDPHNRVVAHPDPVYTAEELRDLSAYPPVAALRNGQTGLLTFTDENGEVWRAYVSTLDNGWGIIAQQPESELLAPVRQFQRVAILLIIIGALVMFALAWFSIRRTLQPIGTLTETVSAIADGNLNRVAEVKSQDEIGILASTFNTMTSQLRDLIGSLEERVAARTRNLELAAEVVRVVTQVRALNDMLKDAAELIRERFDLYYVQVYLTDPSQTNLILQSGTGRVGEQLISRRHRLPLNTSSINGRAATEKRSVVVSNTAASSTFKPNPLLPETRSEMAVPLMIGDRVVGVLDMQSQYAGSLNEEALPAFEALAGQLAIAIQNANYLAETEQARAEVEKQARRLSRVNWTEYLDAIHKPEEIGFVFEQNKVAPLTTDLETKNNALVSTIAVAGETLGNLVVEMEGQSPVARTNELINTVARQVAQQIENLRLLESAERFRYESEQASRRLTHEGWQEYLDTNADKGLGYIYDLKEVRPYQEDELQQSGESLSLPLKVRDETVGKLVVQDVETHDAETLNLVNAVAERLGTHIEGLRLSEKTQSALAQSEKLFEASRALTQATDLQELTATAVNTLRIHEINRAILTIFNYDADNHIESFDVVANWWNGTGHEVTAVGTHYSIDVVRAMSLFVSPVPLFVHDTFQDERMDPTTMEMVKRLNLRAVAILPLYTGAHQVGALILESEVPHGFTQEEIRLFTALAPQISTVLENRRQFERAQQQAERESTLNLINQKIQSATTVEAVLQIAARELGHALGAPMTIAQLGVKDKN